MIRSLLCLTLLAFLASCASSTASTSKATNEGAAVADADVRFDADTHARGVEGWVDVFADDGAQYTRKGWVTGKDAIRALMGHAFETPGFALRWKPEQAAIAPGGNLGFTWGRYRSESKSADGKIETETGTYLTVWKKQADGSWKVQFDTGDADPSAAH